MLKRSRWLAGGRAGGRRRSGVDRLEVWRAGTRVRTVDVWFPPEWIDASRTRVAALLASWGPQYRPSLNAWKNTHKAPRAGPKGVERQ
jgi:hypothetical protein